MFRHCEPSRNKILAAPLYVHEISRALQFKSRYKSRAHKAVKLLQLLSQKRKIHKTRRYALYSVKITK